MIVVPLHPMPIPLEHLSGFGIDDYICLGLGALIFVVATFVGRGHEKEKGEGVPANSEQPAEKVKSE